MPHNAEFHHGLHRLLSKKNLQTKKYIFENYNLTPLDMYNGLSQVNSIKPEGKIHLYVRGQRRDLGNELGPVFALRQYMRFGYLSHWQDVLVHMQSLFKAYTACTHKVWM